MCCRCFYILLTVPGSLGPVFQVLERAFVVSPGFYWATVETPEQVCKGRETTQELHTEVNAMLFKVYFAGVVALFCCCPLQNQRPALY